jgi:hypothetical protein
MSELDVVYISGAPRSGTTLLGMMLGQLRDTCDVGELWALWRPAFRNGDLCGCGRPVRECPFWLAVIEAALGPDFESRGAAIGALHRRRLGTLSAPRVWLHVRGHRRRPEFDRYAEALGQHYRAVAKVSGARIVVDSSKMASDALLASSIPGIRVSVIHLVRDPRGLAWSWRKLVRQPGPDGRQLKQQGTIATGARWDAYNVFAEFLLAPRVAGRFRVLRYEDLLADPASTLGQLAEWIGVPSADRPVQGNPPVLTLSWPTHPVWGNPVRTATGVVSLRSDDEWRRRLPPFDRLVTTWATLPFLVKYHYPIFGSRSPLSDRKPPRNRGADVAAERRSRSVP